MLQKYTKLFIWQNNCCYAEKELSFPDEAVEVVTRRTGEVDNFLTLLTVFLKRLTTAWCFVFSMKKKGTVICGSLL